MIAAKRLFLALPLLVLPSCNVEVGPSDNEVSYSDATGNVVYVDEAPPAPKAEAVIGVAPSPQHVWVGGYWARKAGSWVWIDGHWELRPRSDAVWVPGRWEHHPRGHVWVNGHWR